MDTFVIVKSFSGRYYIYNANGKCVATARSKGDVYSYLDIVRISFGFSSFTFTATAAKSTFIVNMI